MYSFVIQSELIQDRTPLQKTHSSQLYLENGGATHGKTKRKDKAKEGATL